MENRPLFRHITIFFLALIFTNSLFARLVSIDRVELIEKSANVYFQKADKICSNEKLAENIEKCMKHAEAIALAATLKSLNGMLDVLKVDNSLKYEKVEGESVSFILKVQSNRRKVAEADSNVTNNHEHVWNFETKLAISLTLLKRNIRQLVSEKTGTKKFKKESLEVLSELAKMISAALIEGKKS